MVLRGCRVQRVSGWGLGWGVPFSAVLPCLELVVHSVITAGTPPPLYPPLPPHALPPHHIHIPTPPSRAC
jgi:hypothetical protein